MQAVRLKFFAGHGKAVQLKIFFNFETPRRNPKKIKKESFNQKCLANKKMIDKAQRISEFVVWVSIELQSLYKMERFQSVETS